MEDEDKDKNMTVCRNCSNELNIDDAACGDDDGNYYCDECFDEIFAYCKRCNDLHKKRHMTLSDIEDRYYCSDCYYEVFGTCYGCDGEFYQNDLRYSESEDHHYCDECYPQDEEELSHNAKFDFLTSDTHKYNKYDEFIGVEIEFENGLEFKQAFHRGEIPNKLLEEWNFKGDGSLENHGVEVTSLPMNKDRLYDSIKLMCEHINKHGGVVNKRTGLHIHINALPYKVEEIEKIYIAYNLSLPFLKMMVAESRRNNSYCKDAFNEQIGLIKEYHEELLTSGWKSKNMKPYTFKIIGEHSDRYRAINFMSLTTHHTIEIRLHHGTTDKTKIMNWIAINLQIFRWALNQDMKRLLNMKMNKEIFLSEILQYKKLIDYYKVRVVELYLNSKGKQKYEEIQIPQQMRFKNKAKNVDADYEIANKMNRFLIAIGHNINMENGLTGTESDIIDTEIYRQMTQTGD